MVNDKEIECFIPANAIEHIGNPERISLRNKLRLALIRNYQKGNFYADLDRSEKIPTVVVHYHALNPDELGYWIWATMRC